MAGVHRGKEYRNAMNKLIKLVDRLLEGGTLISFLALIGVVSLQVFARFFLPKVPHWTEEASRIFFIYTVCFAGGLAVREKAYVNVDILLNLFRGRLRSFLRLFLDGLVIVFMGLVFYYSIPLVKIGMIQRSPALGVTVSYLFGSITLLSVTMIYYSLFDVINDLRALIGRSN